MKEITLEEVYTMGFVEKPNRPWEKDKPFIIHTFSNKWLDLFQRRDTYLVYLSTIADIKPVSV